MIVEIKSTYSDSKLAINLEKVHCMTIELKGDTNLIIEHGNKTNVLSSKFYNSEDIKKVYDTWVRSKQPTPVEDLNFEVSIKEVEELTVDPQYLSEVFAEYKEYDNLEHDQISCEDAIELVISQFEVLKGVKDGSAN